MRYLALAYDDTKKAIEIVIIKDARNVIEAQLALKKIIAESNNSQLRAGEIYGINAVTMVDPVCQVSFESLEAGESILSSKKVLVS